MTMFRKRRRQMPRLNTSSLPDLIFTILFFFMIATHMRKVTIKVKYRMPQGTELTRLTKKSTVTHIYIGNSTAGGGESRIQINDKFVAADEVADYMEEERKRMSPEDLEQMSANIKADRNTRMGLITDVKLALRQAKVQRIYYAAERETKKQ